MWRRPLRIVSTVVALAITVVSLRSLAADSGAEVNPPPQPVMRSVTVLPDLVSVSRVIATSTLERVAAGSVPDSVRAVLDGSGSVLIVPTSDSGGLQ